MKKIFFILIFYSLYINKLSAQVDPHFSQYYAFPLWLNPGMAGVMDGTYRATAIYRNQWSSVMTPFITSGFSADVATGSNLNLGIDFLSQAAGDGGYKYVTASATIAYGVHFGVNKNQVITMGIRGGLLRRGFDPAKFQFGDQWDPATGFNAGSVSGDVLTKTSASVFDVGSGISYLDGGRGKTVSLFCGLAAFHLTRPEDPFISNSAKEQLPVRFSAHGGLRINLNESSSITPHALIEKQGNAKEFMVGIFGRFAATKMTEVFAGVNYRIKDAVSPFVGFSFNNFVFGASYDVNTSDLGKTVSGTNSLEISLSYMIKNDRESLRYLSCPRF